MDNPIAEFCSDWRISILLSNFDHIANFDTIVEFCRSSIPLSNFDHIVEFLSDFRIFVLLSNFDHIVEFRSYCWISIILLNFDHIVEFRSYCWISILLSNFDPIFEFRSCCRMHIPMCRIANLYSYYLQMRVTVFNPGRTFFNIKVLCPNGHPVSFVFSP